MTIDRIVFLPGEMYRGKDFMHTWETIFPYPGTYGGTRPSNRRQGRNTGSSASGIFLSHRVPAFSVAYALRAGSGHPA